MRLAILAPGASPAFLPESRQGVGGAERQLASLARGLVARGHDVDVLVAANPALDPERPRIVDGVRLWPSFPAGGLPVFKLIHPKGTALAAFLRRRGSELLLQRGASELTGLGRAVTGLLGLPFVFASASDSDFVPGRELLPHPQDRVLFRQGVARADAIVLQSARQRLALRRAQGREGYVLRSFMGGPLPPRPALPGGRAVLWGGNLRPVKRPEWLLALADALPDQRFIVFGGVVAGQERYAAPIQRALNARANVDYRGAVAPEALPGIVAECGVLLITSITEGFPNTLLEAWSGGLEVVSTVDPDGLLAERGLGLVGRTLGELQAGLKAAAAAGEAEKDARRRRAWEHLRQEHDSAALLEKWEGVLQGAIREVRGSTRAVAASGGPQESPGLLPFR